MREPRALKRTMRERRQIPRPARDGTLGRRNGRARRPSHFKARPATFSGGVMQSTQLRAVESFQRVQQFLDAHAGAVGSLKDTEGRKLLDEALAALSSQAVEQQVARRDGAGQ